MEITSALSARPRHLAIDFFRGWALLVIFINHIPHNEWMMYTPSRIGFSDASEIFIFLSGYAAALSYGRNFKKTGLSLTTLAVVYRCLQLYVCHLGLFLVFCTICVLGNESFVQPDYIGRLNLHYFFNQPSEALLYLVTLRYLPNFFDILPLYIMVMLCLPLILQTSSSWPKVALFLPVLIYVARWQFDLQFSADPHTDRPWFFNPFAWQLLFFSGFAISSGWVKLSVSKNLLRWCFVLILIAIPLSYPPTYLDYPLLREARLLLEPFLDKTNFGPLRWLHFMALAIVIRAGLQHWPVLMKHWLAQPLIKLGQQSLPIFLFCMVLSYVGGIFLDQLGHAASTLIAVNMGGMILLMISAYGLGWIQSKPWKQYRIQQEGFESSVTLV